MFEGYDGRVYYKTKKESMDSPDEPTVLIRDLINANYDIFIMEQKNPMFGNVTQHRDENNKNSDVVTLNGVKQAGKVKLQ